MSPEDLSTIRHMLGLPDECVVGRMPEPYRNYAAVNPGDAKFVRLVDAGLVERYREAAFGLSSYDWFKTTDAGRQAAFASVRQVRLTKAQLRYRKWLAIDDGSSFRDFLTEPHYADARRTA